MTLVEDDGPQVRAVVALPGCSRAQALQAFTSPDLVRSWWGGGELTAELIPGGRYEVWFAGIPARMTGRVVSYEPAIGLEFTWAWEHEPDAPARSVAIRTGEAADGSTTLRIEHGPHDDDDDGLAARQEHREGWEYFLARLQALLAA